MAMGTMSNYTGKILWRSPDNAAALFPARVNGSGLYPGMAVTNEGQTSPDVYIPDGNDDKTAGIVLDRADKGVDTVFSDNDWCTVAAIRSGAGVWGIIDDDEGAITQWTPLYNTGADDDGFLEVLQVTAAPTTYDDATIQGIVDYLESAEVRYAGRAATAQGDQGSTDTPLKVLLV